MELVLLTAAGVGGATVFGALIGFIFKKISHKFSDIVLSFAAGVMLAAAVLGLILPSVEYGGDYGIMKSFSSLVHAGKPCMVGIKGARDSAAIAIAAYESEHTGMPVMIPKCKELEGMAK